MDVGDAEQARVLGARGGGSIVALVDEEWVVDVDVLEVLEGDVFA